MSSEPRSELHSTNKFARLFAEKTNKSDASRYLIRFVLKNVAFSSHPTIMPAPDDPTTRKKQKTPHLSQGMGHYATNVSAEAHLLHTAARQSSSRPSASSSISDSLIKRDKEFPQTSLIATVSPS